jgi:arginase family enzyme
LVILVYELFYVEFEYVTSMICLVLISIDILRLIKTTLTCKEVPINLLLTFPFFIGGDRSITTSILSISHHAYPLETKIGLIYFDGDVDLTNSAGRHSSSQRFENVRLHGLDTPHTPRWP